MDEFYIGYLSEAPKETSRMMRLSIVTLGVILAAVSAIVAIHQKPFSKAMFEYGKYTTIQGTLYLAPVPHVRVSAGNDIASKEIFQNVLLVAAGKKGFTELLRASGVNSSSMQGRNVEVKGFLITGNGKAMLQVNEIAHVRVLGPSTTPPMLEMGVSAGVQLVAGEIVDPKCYFGVMKPGLGKTHRACAIRCIAGGITPVFKATDGMYYLIVGEKDEPVNDVVLPVVGDYLTLEGEVVLMTDWRILRMKRASLQRLSTTKGDAISFLDDGITMCTK